MTVHLQEPALSYFSVPKCACTSLKSLFFEYEHGLTFEEAQSRGSPLAPPGTFVHGVYPSRPFAETAPAAAPGAWRFAVVRDPLSRVVSCYRNRLSKQKTRRQLERNAKKMAARGIPVRPSLAEFVEHLPVYRELIGDIRGHSEPLSVFLGRDPAYFDRIFHLGEIDALHRDLAQRMGQIPALPHLQTSGQRVTAADLAPKSAARIRELYAEDYALYGAYWQTAPGR